MTTVLELDDVIRRHAWSLLKKRTFALRRWFLDENDYTCHVDWQSILFEHNVSKFSIRPDGKTFNMEWGTVETGLQWVPLHACEFENRSDAKQTHTFRCSRETTTWIAVELAQTFTTDKQVDVDVNFPPQFSHFRAMRDTGFKVTKVKGNVFKELLEWEVNSLVDVTPSWKATAMLLAKEETHVVDFEVRTTLSVPNGVVPVQFKKVSDGSTAFEVKVFDLEQAFQAVEDGGVLTEDESPMVHALTQTQVDRHGNQTSDTRLQLLTRGACVVVAWADQKVDIKTAPLGDGNGEDGDVTATPTISPTHHKTMYVVKT